MSDSIATRRATPACCLSARARRHRSVAGAEAPAPADVVGVVEPFVFALPRWPCLGWTLADVVDVIGSDTEVQYQVCLPQCCDFIR
jgi:hypothetical protein